VYGTSVGRWRALGPHLRELTGALRAAGASYDS